MLYGRHRAPKRTQLRHSARQLSNQTHCKLSRASCEWRTAGQDSLAAWLCIDENHSPLPIFGTAADM
eukprot:11340897-Prorocentrum_lima.AAC.1